MSAHYKNYIFNICCVCLCKKPELVKVTGSKRANTETWVSKLTNCVAEIKWSNEYHICPICSNQLDFVYNFRRLCLESREKRDKILATSSKRSLELNRYTECPVDNNDLKLEANPCIAADKPICNYCNLTFTTTEELDEHSNKFHTKEIEIDAENIIDDLSNDDSNSSLDSWKPQTKKLMKTRQASKIKHASKLKQGSKRKQASKSEETSLPDLALKCYSCVQTFDSIIKLVRHSRTEHNIARKDVKPYACHICDRRFTIPCKLKVHMMYHEGIRNEICSHCGKGFPTKKALHVHEQIHQNREYQCSYCPKKFNTKGNRRGHERTVHLDPSKWFACHICSKKFNKKDNLVGHIRRHTNEKPFACQVCEMRFCSSTDLRMHSKTHSNIRQYKCPECEKDYKYRNQLNYHLTRTHNIYR